MQKNICHKQILSLGIQKVWAFWVESQTIGWNLVEVSQTNLGMVNGSHGTIHAGWTRSPSWLVWCFCFAFVCLVMFPWSLGHLGGTGFFALLEHEDAQKKRTWIYHICIRMFVRSWPAWWYQFMYTKNAWIYTYHNIPSKTHHPMKIFVKCFRNFLGLCQAVDKVQMLVLKTYSFIRSQVCDQARNKYHLKAVFFYLWQFTSMIFMISGRTYLSLQGT